MRNVSVVDGAPAGGSGIQYFVGEFDGERFHNHNPPDLALWQNYGPDYYAGVTWGDPPFPDSRRLMIAWLDKWQYRDIVPTQSLNGQLALIRELTLRRFPEGERLVQTPVDEYTRLRGANLTQMDHHIVRAGEHTIDIFGGCTRDHRDIRRRHNSGTRVRNNVRQGENERTAIGYDLRRGEM